MAHTGTPRWPLTVDGKLVYPTATGPGWSSYSRDGTKEFPVTSEQKEAIEKAIASTPSGAQIKPVETTSYRKKKYGLRVIDRGVA